MRFGPIQYRAIQREKAKDKAIALEAIPAKIAALAKEERGLNDLFWSWWRRGKVAKEDEDAVALVRGERDAIRVRIMRLQRRRR